MLIAIFSRYAPAVASARGRPSNFRASSVASESCESNQLWA